ncbi:MAG: hypothetical protein GYB33_16965 [Gammaproteobacteria bacterium]|nr:hypothetical protein [Gammaproteobacteria bacterium]
MLVSCVVILGVCFALFSSGLLSSAPFGGALYRYLDQALFGIRSGPLVQQLPAGYDRYAPRQAYSGPHPSQRPFAVDAEAFPVDLGAVGPIDTSLGPPQYPFACDSQASGLGQPLVDNQQGAGVAVTDSAGKIIGYSKDCQVPARAEYFYAVQGSDQFQPLPAGELPGDMTWIERDGQRIPFVIRLERGTINRFIYAIAVLQNPNLPVATADPSYWNGRLLYFFRGGVGIGKVQGKVTANTIGERRHQDLAQGYAVAFSSGTHTRNHYDVVRAGHTAAMVVAQFRGRYGAPELTLGLGESGGAVLQYLTAQNQPGLLDGLITGYSYPDMITQTIWVLDCDLLEYYFDVTAADQPRWQKQEERTLIEGLTADSNLPNRFANVDKWMRRLSLRPPLAPGSTECARGWRGLTAMTNNPHFYHRALRFSPGVRAGERFSHWHDLKWVYGVDESGYARRTFDNTGVQYGLKALRSGRISPAEFLHLNANIGAWKAPADMAPERLWVLSEERSFSAFSLWSDHNMRKTPGGATPLSVFQNNAVDQVRVAPRNRGSLEAIAAAYRSGQVFVGDIDVPVIDVRHYLDDRLDMHHSFASLSARLRIAAARGKSDNMLVWVADPAFNPAQKARDLLVDWLQNGKPAAAVDTCFDAGGNTIAAGEGVWDGVWNGRPQGPCLQRYPAHETSRNVAGAPLAGDLFSCALIPVAVALERDFYAPLDMSPYRQMLEKVFADGVCDYTLGDLGRPEAIKNPASGNWRG